MTRALRSIFFFALVAAPQVARAGGFELTEQSAAGLAMAGAQAAKADDPAAIYYNPAGITFQRGLGVMGGVNIIHADTDVSQSTPGGLTFTSHASTTAPAPTIFASERLGSHFAVGLGLFSNFAQHFEYPKDYSGRFIASYFDLKTFTINPTVAIRPIPRLAIGFGLDIVPAWLTLTRSLNFGSASPSAQGTVSIATDAVGVGGNIGIMGIIVPRWLTAGVTYRSAVVLDFSGRAALAAPPELMASGFLSAQTSSVTLPHNLSFALSTQPREGLSINAEAHLALWQDLNLITLTLNQPGAPASMAQKQQLILNWQNSVGVRVGGEYVLLGGRLPLRLGVGWDQTPVPSSTITPIAPDADRIIVSAGGGYRHGIFSADVGYLAAILLSRTGANPEFPGATYASVGHVVAINVAMRLENIGMRVNQPDYKH